MRWAGAEPPSHPKLYSTFERSQSHSLRPISHRVPSCTTVIGVGL